MLKDPLKIQAVSLEGILITSEPISLVFEATSGLSHRSQGSSTAQSGSFALLMSFLHLKRAGFTEDQSDMSRRNGPCVNDKMNEG